MTRAFDVAVIGAGVGGLAAAALLAKRGARVLLAEEQLAPPVPFGALFALDPDIVAALKLGHHGLCFTRRDLALGSWSDEAPPLLLRRDPRAAQQALAAVGDPAAGSWAGFEARLKDEARALRRWWWNAMTESRPEQMLGTRAARDRFARVCVAGAEDLLAFSLESPRLVAALLFDAGLGGLAPSEPGSALALVWRAAQEMAGLQGACAVAQPGSLIAALRAACRSAGVEMRLGAKVESISLRDGAAAGLVLADGEEIAARAVLSSLVRARTEGLAGLAVEAQDASTGEARLLFTLAEDALPPMLDEARIILAETPEIYADAHEAARAGRLAAVLPFECVKVAPGRLAVTVRPLPLAPPGGWAALEALLAARIVKALARHIPGCADALTRVEVRAPRPVPRATLARLTASAATRAATRCRGLYLCGEDAEPLPSVSGRAGRFAATFAAAHLR